MTTLLNPFWFGSGDVEPTVPEPLGFASFECPTATGNINITAAMGGTTPKLAIFMLTSHRFDQDPLASDGVFMALSACTSSDQVFSDATMRNNNSLTVSRREVGDGSVCHIRNSSGTLISDASFVQFLPNGIRLNFTTAPSLQYTGIVWFFGGDDVDTSVGLLDLNGAAGARTVSGLGFQPNFLMTGDSGDSTATGNQTRAIFNIGATDGSVNRSSHVTQDTANSSGACRQAVRDDCVSCLYSSVSGTLIWKVGFTSFDADGFTLNIDANPGETRQIMWIAINLAAGEFGIIPLVTPTETGEQAYTGMGFTPDAVMGWATTQESINPASPLTTSLTLAGGSGFFSFDTDSQYAISWSHGDDGLTVANSDLKSSALRLGDGSEGGTGAVNASLTSLDADGFTLNYSAVLAGAKIGWAVGIKKP